MIEVFDSSVIEYAYRRFARERFPLPSEAQVAALEEKLGITFPEDYRDFLLRFNGGAFDDPTIEPTQEGCPQDMLNTLWGIGASIDSAELGEPGDIELFDDNVPPKVLPIGDTPMGSLILLDTAPGEENGMIYFDESFGESYYLADGIGEFFELLKETPPSEEE